MILGYHRTKMVNLALILYRIKWPLCHQNWLVSWYVVVDTWHTVFSVLWYPIVKFLKNWLSLGFVLTPSICFHLHVCRPDQLTTGNIIIWKSTIYQRYHTIHDKQSLRPTSKYSWGVVVKGQYVPPIGISFFSSTLFVLTSWQLLDNRLQILYYQAMQKNNNI